MTHKLKTVNPYFDAVWNGEKTFEVRKDDRGFCVGDQLYLQEYDAANNRYLTRSIWVVVTYILKDKPFVPDGYVIMGIKTLGASA